MLALASLLASCADDGGEAGTARIAFLASVPSTSYAPFLDALADAGFREGDNLDLIQDDPVGETYPDEASATAAVERWVAQEVDLIVALSSTGARAAAAVTSEVPILFLVNDPQAVGLVDDESSPDANLTGTTFRVPADRTLDLARQALPGLAHLGVLSPADDPATPPARDAMVRAAGEVSVRTTTAQFATLEDIPAAMASLDAAGVGAVLVVNTPTAIRAFATIEAAATPAGIPLIANTTFAVGATVVLEPNVDEVLGQLGRQAARLLRGTSPADVPVENPRQFRLVLDAGKAASLGLAEFPAGVVRQADDVRR